MTRLVSVKYCGTSIDDAWTSEFELLFFLPKTIYSIAWVRIHGLLLIRHNNYSNNNSYVDGTYCGG